MPVNHDQLAAHSGTSSALPPPPSPAEVIERMLEAFTAGDVGGLIRWFDPGVVVHQADSLPYGGSHRGHAGFLAMLARLGTTYEVQMSSYTVAAAGSTVVLRMELTFTARTSGRSAKQPTVELYTVGGGLITGVDVFYKDTQAVLDLLEA